MKKCSLCYVLFFFSLSSCSEIGKKASSEKKVDIVFDSILVGQGKMVSFKDSVDKMIPLSFMQEDSLGSVLELTEISEKYFLQCKRNYQSRFNIDSTQIAMSDSFFTIQTSKARIQYNNEYNQNYGNRKGFHWFNYKGYIEPLHLYVLESWGSGEFTIGDLLLIDSLTNIAYYPIPMADNPFEVPVLSTDNKNWAVQLNGMLEVGSILRTDSLLSYKAIARANLGYDYMEIVWVNSNTLALKGVNSVYHEKQKNNTIVIEYSVARF